METEVKTTGIRERGHGEYVAKEPMSVTAVSPNAIVNEDFESSHFWDKLAHMLLVYYLYRSDTTVEARDYADFPVKGYEFHEFSDTDKERLKNDWTIVRDFIIRLQNDYDCPENEYPRLSHELREQLMYIDTTPKWPNPPRFRLKRSLVNDIVQDYFTRRKASSLPGTFNRYSDINEKCHSIADAYHGSTVIELMQEFNIPVKDIEKLDKSINERIIVNMFGGSARKLNDIDLFKKIGLHGKTVVINSKGGRTEDTKLFAIDFSDILDENNTFEDSYLYEYFADHQFLCIMFKEPFTGCPFKDNRFLGFKRVSFDDEFISREVGSTWRDIRDTVFSGNLKEIPVKKNGVQVINPNGTPKVAINFPKSADHIVFVRGGEQDSSDKHETVTGIKMLKQSLWIKRSYFTSILNNMDYL